jgi:hypothetical protein
VKLPGPRDRTAIMRKHLRKTPLALSFDVEKVASDHRGTGFSGADVASLVQSLLALQSLLSLLYLISLFTAVSADTTLTAPTALFTLCAVSTRCSHCSLCSH